MLAESYDGCFGFFPVAPEIALIQRFGGQSNIWTGTSYENSWVGMGPNMGPTGEFGPGVGGGVSAPSQPSGQPSTEPPEEESPGPQPEPTPEIPQEPEQGKPTSAPGGEGPPGGGEREGLTPEGGSIGSGQGATPGAAVIADIKSGKSFLSWLRGLFG